MAIGIGFDEFWHMTPHKVMLCMKAHEKQLEEENLLAHLQGQYFVEALLATVGNMFSGKGAHKFTYPEKPHELFAKPVEERELTQEEKDTQVQALFADLMARKARLDTKKNQDTAPVE